MCSGWRAPARRAPPGARWLRKEEGLWLRALPEEVVVLSACLRPTFLNRSLSSQAVAVQQRVPLGTEPTWGPAAKQLGRVCTFLTRAALVGYLSHCWGEDCLAQPRRGQVKVTETRSGSALQAAPLPEAQCQPHAGPAPRPVESD